MVRSHFAHRRYRPQLRIVASVKRATQPPRRVARRTPAVASKRVVRRVTFRARGPDPHIDGRARWPA